MTARRVYLVLLLDLISPVGVSQENATFCLSIWLVEACYSLSVRGLQLVMVVSHLVMEKTIPTPSQVGIWIQTSRDVLHPIGEM